MTEKPVKTFGERGSRVRVYRMTTATGTKLLRAEWREGNRKRRESWPDTRENERTAKAYADGVSSRLQAKRGGPKAPVTLAELVRSYRLANTHWRPATMTNRLHRLAKFLTFAGEQFRAADVTPDMIDEYRDALAKLPLEKTGKRMVPNQVAAHASEVKSLLRFAKVRGKIDENPLNEYVVRLSKNEQRDETHEYSNVEWGRILAALNPKSASQWRAYCLILMAGTLGPRQRALRHLQWADVDLRTRDVHWRMEMDKMGKERTQPLPRDAVRALRIAKVWRARDKYRGAWIFYQPTSGTKGTGDKPYSYQSLAYWLHEAERRAGVDHIPFRAMHGYRRTAAGNVFALTGGDVKAAGDWIGDSDLKSLQKYLKKRDERQREIAGMVSAPPTERPPEKADRKPAEAKS